MLFKLGTIAAIALSSFVLALLRQQGLYWFAALALIFSWLGDACLANFAPFARFLRPLIYWGMGFFAAAQICYAVAMLMFIADTPSQGRSAVWIMLGYEAVGVALWWLLAGRGERDIALSAAVLIYALCLVTMAGAACAAAFRAERFLWTLFVGSILFVLSDGLIAAGWFLNANASWLGILIWATYVPAQVLIQAGFWMMRVNVGLSATL
ncbi:MAG: lysoplasmalogenase [Oscillospiraceae bacterium]|jgi:hypothetical protein|nr:lysoplasmalogenase [Oscillospiraceae bacterium]